MYTSEMAREGRMRRLARRFDLQLVKSRRWIDAGRFAIVDPFHNLIVYGTDKGGEFVADLDDVEGWLTSP